METIKIIVKFLDGKKTTIAGVLGLIITYAQSKGYIGNDEAVLFSSILLALGFGANYVKQQTPNA